jgi:hypothetical protein
MVTVRRVTGNKKAKYGGEGRVDNRMIQQSDSNPRGMTKYDYDIEMECICVEWCLDSTACNG